MIQVRKSTAWLWVRLGSTDTVYRERDMLILRQWQRRTIFKIQNICCKLQKKSTPGLVPKHWLWFSYIHSKDYEFDLQFNETEMKGHQTTHEKIKLNRLEKYCGHWEVMILWYELNWWCNLSDGLDQMYKIQFQLKKSIWQKAMHMRNHNRQWLEYTSCPYIFWGTWWWIYFHKKSGNYTNRTCWTITQVGLEKFQVSGAIILRYIIWWVIKRTFWSLSGPYKNMK